MAADQSLFPAQRFALPGKLEDVPVMNAGSANLRWLEVSCHKSVTGGDFATGEQKYAFTVGANQRWIPAMSYLAVRTAVGVFAAANTAPTQPTGAEGIAPAMLTAATLFSSVNMTVGNESLGRINEYLPQISALKLREQRSDPYLRSIGARMNMEAQFAQRAAKIDAATRGADLSNADRLTRGDLGVGAGVTVEITALTRVVTFSAAVLAQTGAAAFAVGDYIEIGGIGTSRLTAAANDGLTVTLADALVANNVAAAVIFFARLRPRASVVSANRQELAWRPPLAIFDVREGLPAGSYSLLLQPASSSWKLASVESNRAIANAANGCDTYVEGCVFYACVVDVAKRTDDESSFGFALAPQEWSAQSYAIGTETSIQRSFTVPKSTTAVAVAFQSVAAGTDTRYSPTKFRSANNVERNLLDLRISYSGQDQPSYDPAAVFSATQDWTTHNYLRNAMLLDATGDGGYESYEDFLERGPYTHREFIVDAGAASDQLRIVAGTSANMANTQMLVFTRRTVAISASGDAQGIKSVAYADAL